MIKQAVKKLTEKFGKKPAKQPVRENKRNDWHVPGASNSYTRIHDSLVNNQKLLKAAIKKGDKKEIAALRKRGARLRKVVDVFMEVVK